MKTYELNPEFLKTRRKKKKVISPTIELTLKVIYNFQINDKIFFGSDFWLADERNLTERSIQNHLNKLDKIGFIDRSQKYKGKRRIICLKPAEEYFHYFRKKSTGTSGKSLPEVPEKNFPHNTQGNSKGNPSSNSTSETVDFYDTNYNKRLI